MSIRIPQRYPKPGHIVTNKNGFAVPLFLVTGTLPTTLFWDEEIFTAEAIERLPVLQPNSVGR